MTIISNVLSYNNAKPSMFSFINPPIIPQSSCTFRNATRLYKSYLNASKPPSRTALTLLGNRFTCMQSKSLATLNIHKRVEAPIRLDLTANRIVALNIQASSIPTSRSAIPNKRVEALVPLEFAANRISALNIQDSSIPTSSVAIPTNDSSLGKLVQFSKRKKLISWILTSHNVYGLAITVLHNFFDICYQKPEERNFINDLLIPRVRYAGFTISTFVSVIYHVAIGVLFTPLVAATLGQKKEINEIWYGYWAEASISTVSVFAGIFGIVSGNYLIYKNMEKIVPDFKKLLTSCLERVQKLYTRLSRMDFSQLRQEVEDVNTTSELISITQKLVGIAKDHLLPILDL